MRRAWVKDFMIIGYYQKEGKGKSKWVVNNLYVDSFLIFITWAASQDDLRTLYEHLIKIE